MGYRVKVVTMTGFAKWHFIYIITNIYKNNFEILNSISLDND